MSTRAVGEAALHGGKWKIGLEPHAMIVLKRLFPKVDKAELGTVTLAHNPATARELLWFFDRYPVAMSAHDATELAAGAAAHVEQASLVERMLSKDYVPPTVTGMALPPREYQRVAAALAHEVKSILLGDKMGLGKTVSAITLLMYPDTLPALVVTLTPLPKQWEAMIHRFAPHLRTHVLKKGTPYDFLHKPRSRTGEKLPFPDVILTSYSKLQGWAETFARMDAFRTLIGDECHELRHPGTQRYAAWQLIRSKVTYCLGTTGTPVYGMGSQIHHVINAIRPDALGTWSEFVRERCGAATDDKPVVKDPDALGEHLRREGLMLRRTTEEVGAELPPIQRLVQAIEIDDKPLRAVESRAQELAAIILASNATPFARMDASAEIDWRVRQATGIGKAPYVVEFIRMLLESGEKKVLVYAWHREVYALMAEAFKDLNPAFYTGSESQPQKEESKRRFVDGETPLLIMSLRSGAGLDGLQYAGCRVAVFAELDWSPAVHEQAECRIYRDGQPDPVLVYYLVADSGSDPFVMDVLGIKADQAHGIIDPNKARAATSREAQQAMRDRIRTMAASYAGKRGGDVERALSEAQMALPIEAEDGSVGCLHSV